MATSPSNECQDVATLDTGLTAMDGFWYKKASHGWATPND